jgi:hypothetical protein
MPGLYVHKIETKKFHNLGGKKYVVKSLGLLKQTTIGLGVLVISGFDLDSKTVAVAAPVNSLEAFMLLVAWQGGRESTRGNDQSLRLRKDKCMCHDPC